MSTTKKGTLIQAPEWRKHLRPDGKRQTAKRERQAAAKLIRREGPQGTLPVV